MAHQLNGLFPRSLLKAFSVLIFIILLKDVCNGQPQLIGPSQALVARAGDDVILPCHVEPAYDVSTNTLEWTRSSLDPKFVYVSRGGQEIEILKNPSFKKRTSVFVDELKYGNISLKISKVKFNDTGTYKCYIPEMKKEAFVELVVASDAATSPAISLSGIDKNSGVVLQCESAGWYPEPELLWLDGEGNLLSAGPTETLRGPDDLYTVSSRVTVEKRHSNSITCTVQQRNTNQSRKTHIHVPEDFFEFPCSSSSVIIGLAVTLALCIILLILSAVVLLLRNRNPMMNTNRSPKDQTDVEGAEVPLMKTKTAKQNMSSSTINTKKQTSCTIKSEKNEFIQKLMETFLTKLSESISQQTKSEKKSEINNQLQQVKEAAEKLKNQLESKNQQMINSETDEFIQKLMETFLTLDSKVSESISQQTELENKLKDEEKLKEETNKKVKQLEKNNTETINQLLQEKQAAENLKNQFKSKCHEMIKSERDEIIQKLMETFPTQDSKVSESISQQTESEKITENIKQEFNHLKNTTAKLKDWLEKNSHEMFKSEMDEIIQKDMETFLTKRKRTLKEVKATSQLLKTELENKSQQMINSEKENDEIIKKLMKTFPTLDSKWKKNTDIIKQLEQVKQRAEGLKKQLEPQTHESEEETETIRQLQQLEQAAEILKIQLESKNQQMIKSEREKNEIIQNLMKIFPTLDSKLKENTDIIHQLQEVKETAEKLKLLEKKNLELQGETDSDIIKQLQRVKDKAENLKHQMESINWQMLLAEKMRNEETDRKLKALVKQLEEKNKTEETLNELQLSGNISQAQEDKQKMETLRNELDSTNQQLQQEKKAAENLKKQLEEKNRELSGNISQAQEEKQKMEREMERLRNELESRNQQLQLSGNMSQAQEEKQKMEREMERLRNELESTNQQLQQEKQAAKDLKKQLEEKNPELSGNISQAQEDKQKMERLRNELYSTKQQQQKGDIILDKVDVHGPYICLRNTSSEDKMMTGWELKQQINNRNPVTYKFETNFTLKAGEGLTLYRLNSTSIPYPDNTHMRWAEMSGWYSGEKLKISLISDTGEEHRLM